jgi:nicotinamide-nucleotide amidase
MNSEIDLLAFIAVENLRGAGLTVTTAESCTGGMIATAITEVPGASQVFRYGWVTYCNEAKERLLNVPTELIEEHTVVSEPVVAAMATAAMRQSGADIAVAVSGNAGPTAAEGEPAVGSVCIALARRGAARPVHTETIYLPGMPRRQLRQRVTAKVLQLIAGAAS